MITNFTGYDVIVRDDDTGETLLMGKVDSYSKERSIIEVNLQCKYDLSARHLRVLLHHDGRAYSFNGTYRKLSGSTNIGIALFNGNQKQDRKNERFAIDLYADICDCNTQEGEILNNIKNHTIRIVDISRSGVCLQGINIPLTLLGKIKFFHLHHPPGEKTLFCPDCSHQRA